MPARAGNGVIVMLDGQGADEALGGYHGYFATRLAGLVRGGRWLEGWREAAAVRALHGQGWKLQAQLLANELAPAGLRNALRRLVGRAVETPAFLDLARLGAAPRAPQAHPIDWREPVRSLGHAQLTALNLPMLLHYEDRNSMAHGVEARLPFLDYRLVEFCLGLPEEFKLARGETKRVLRAGMRDRLPSACGRAATSSVSPPPRSLDARARPREFLGLVDEAVAAAAGALTPPRARRPRGCSAARNASASSPGASSATAAGCGGSGCSPAVDRHLRRSRPLADAFRKGPGLAAKRRRRHKREPVSRAVFFAPSAPFCDQRSFLRRRAPSWPIPAAQSQTQLVPNPRRPPTGLFPFNNSRKSDSFLGWSFSRFPPHR